LEYEFVAPSEGDQEVLLRGEFHFVCTGNCIWDRRCNVWGDIGLVWRTWAIWIGNFDGMFTVAGRYTPHWW
jgi:hypothetical protein